MSLLQICLLTVIPYLKLSRDVRMQYEFCYSFCCFIHKIPNIMAVTCHVHFQSKIHHATSTCPFIWDVLEHVACCRRVAPGNSNTPHVDGCMLLPHSNQTVTLMVVRFNMIFILKFIIPADHSDNSW